MTASSNSTISTQANVESLTLGKQQSSDTALAALEKLAPSSSQPKLTGKESRTRMARALGELWGPWNLGQALSAFSERAHAQGTCPTAP